MSIINLHHNLQSDKHFPHKEFISFLLQAMPEFKALLEKKRKTANCIVILFFKFDKFIYVGGHKLWDQRETKVL